MDNWGTAIILSYIDKELDPNPDIPLTETTDKMVQDAPFRFRRVVFACYGPASNREVFQRVFGKTTHSS